MRWNVIVTLWVLLALVSGAANLSYGGELVQKRATNFEWVVVDPCEKKIARSENKDPMCRRVFNLTIRFSPVEPLDNPLLEEGPRSWEYVNLSLRELTSYVEFFKKYPLVLFDNYNPPLSEKVGDYRLDFARNGRIVKEDGSALIPYVSLKVKKSELMYLLELLKSGEYMVDSEEKGVHFKRVVNNGEKPVYIQFIPMEWLMPYDFIVKENGSNLFYSSRHDVDLRSAVEIAEAKAEGLL